MEKLLHSIFPLEFMERKYATYIVVNVRIISIVKQGFLVHFLSFFGPKS